MAKSWLLRAMFALSAGVGVASCTLLSGVDVLHVDDSAFDASEASVKTDATPTDSGNPDTGIFGDIDASVVDGCSQTGCFAIPLGFQLVAFGVKGAPCPTGFTNPLDLVNTPTVAGNACACDCTVTTPPTCPSNGTMASSFSAAGTGCTQSGATISGGCTTDGFVGVFSANNSDRRYDPPGATGGACNAFSNKNAAALTTGDHRVCQATVIPECDSKLCLPAVDNPNFKACIAASGAAECPAEFPNKTPVGTKADFDCGGNCGCNVTAKCSGKLNFYFPGSCAGTPDITFIADGTCHATNNNSDGGVYASHKYVPDAPSNIACAKTGSTTATTPTLTQLTTVCCN